MEEIGLYMNTLDWFVLGFSLVNMNKTWVGNRVPGDLWPLSVQQPQNTERGQLEYSAILQFPDYKCFKM